jgi:hypothetical protein
MKNKKILVIHPKDPSTDFLSTIYKNMNAMVIRQEIDDKSLNQLIKDSDRVVMLGHGTPKGLMGPSEKGYIINETHVELLKKKKDNIYIWCHADKFVELQDLSGFSTGMFISETIEANIYNIDATETEVTKSNNRFARLVRNYIHKSTKELKDIVKENYILDSDVARYNNERLYHF